MHVLYFYKCFDSAHIIQRGFVFEGALYFFPVKSYTENFAYLAMKFRAAQEALTVKKNHAATV